MKVYLDCTALTNKPTGVGTYIHHLLLEMFKLNKAKEYEWVLLFRTGLNLKNESYLTILEAVKNLKNEIVYIDCPVVGPKRQLYFFLNKKKLFKGDYIYHCMHSNFPIVMGANGIATIHDLKYVLFPKFMGGKLALIKSLYLKFIFTKTLKTAKKIICVSKSTEHDLVKVTGQSNENIQVIYEGFQRNNIKPIKKIHSKVKKALFVGEWRPHKNILGLLKAFEYYQKTYSQVNLHLQIVGTRHSTSPEIDKLFQKSKSSIEVFENISNEKLVELYSQCDFFVLPSYYEGFGLPVLEAMSFGKPCVLSSVSSLPEVGGDAALYVHPDNHSKLAECMYALVNDSRLYSKLVSEIELHLTKFSWYNTASETIKLYEK